MPTGWPRVYMCFGTPKRHLGQLETAAQKGGQFDWWNIKKSAAHSRIGINPNSLLSRV